MDWVIISVVFGRSNPEHDTWIAKSIAIAASHPIGAGDARYRIGGVAQEVDTVPFGAFKKDLINRIGMYR